MCIGNKKVQCITCGYLNDFEHQEVKPEKRRTIITTGRFGHDDGHGIKAEDCLYCHRWQLRNAIEHKEKAEEKRKCKYHVEYHPGYSPDQHLQIQKDEQRDRKYLITASAIGTISALIGAVVGSFIS